MRKIALRKNERTLFTDTHRTDIVDLVWDKLSIQPIGNSQQIGTPENLELLVTCYVSDGWLSGNSHGNTNQLQAGGPLDGKSIEMACQLRHRHVHGWYVSFIMALALLSASKIAQAQIE